MKGIKGELTVSINEEQVTLTMTTGLKELVDSLSPAQTQVAFDAIVLYGVSISQALERALGGSLTIEA